MTELIVKTSKDFYQFFRISLPFNFWRLLFLLVILSVYVNGITHEAISAALADAYYGVSVFVFATMALILFLEKALKQDFGVLMHNSRFFQIPLAAVLGATPGCGGAIAVTVQYARGYASFGSLVAALTATMGDAAFLLLAREPAAGFLMIAICLVAGVVAGYSADALKIGARMKIRAKKNNLDDNPKPLSEFHYNTKKIAANNQDYGNLIFFTPLPHWLRKPACYLLAITFIPGFAIGVLRLMQWGDKDIGDYFAVSAAAIENFAVIMILIKIVFWCLKLFPDNTDIANTRCHTLSERIKIPLIDRLIGDCCFVTSLVALAFVGYELWVVFFGGLEVFFKTIPYLMPLIAVLIGFIPGCGPQIVVCSLYITGVIPFSALIANAISNDGDALFPAIAIAPRASIYATLYTALPALIISYCWYFFLE